MDTQDIQAVKDLLATARLYPEERAGIIFLLGRITRLEAVETAAREFIAALPEKLEELQLFARTQSEKKAFPLLRKSLVTLGEKVRK
jgi:hypothetical protein